MPKRVKTTIAYAIACPHCECGNVLSNPIHGMAIFETEEQAKRAVEGAKTIEGDFTLSEDDIIKIRIAEHG